MKKLCSNIAILFAIIVLCLSWPLAGRAVGPPVLPFARVVIDPGHGAGDHGVTGPAGLAESGLTLALARQLKDAVETEFGAEVFLTRDEGQNPGLEERAALSNRLGADIFISLHGAGAASALFSGFHVLFQDYRFQAGLAAEVSSEAPGETGPLEWELVQAGYLPASRNLAMELDRALGEVLRIGGHGPEGLPLALLSGVSCPAVLIEVGYLTNPEEERRLKGQPYRDALVRAMMRGLRSWAAAGKLN